MSNFTTSASYGLSTALLPGSSDESTFPLGTYLLCIVLDALFMGIIFCQTIVWALRCRGNPLAVKIMIPLSFLAAVSATCYTWAQSLQDFSIHFQLDTRFLQYNISGWYGLIGMMILAPILVILVERVYLTTGRNIWAALGGIILTITVAAAGIWCTIATRTVVSLQVLKNIFVYWGSASFASQLVATGCTFYYASNLTVHGTGAVRAVSILLQANFPGTIIAAACLVVIVLGINSAALPMFMLAHPKLYLTVTLAGLNFTNAQSANATPVGDVEAGAAYTSDSSSTLNKEAVSTSSPASEPVPTPDAEAAANPEVMEQTVNKPLPPLPSDAPVAPSSETLDMAPPIPYTHVKLPQSQPYPFGAIKILFASDKPTSRLSRDRGELIIDD